MEISDDGTARAPFISTEKKKKKKNGGYVKCTMDENIRKACDAVSNSRYTTRSTMVSSKFSGKGIGERIEAICGIFHRRFEGATYTALIHY